MGHLVNPISFRLGISRFWGSNWSFTNTNYKYKFLMRSEWNIHTFLSRLFSNSFLINSALIYSHSLFIRTADKFICNIFFWDGLMLETFRDDLNELLYYLYNHNIINKMLVSLSFFDIISRSFSDFSQKFLLFKNLFLFYNFFLSTFLYKMYFSLLLNNKDHTNRKIFFRSDFFFKITLFFVKLKYQMNLCFSKFLFKYKTFCELSLFLLRKFVISFKNIFNVIDNFASMIRNSTVSNNFIILIIQRYLEYFFNLYMSKKNLNYPVITIFHPISHLDITSAFLSRYLAIRLKQRYRLMQALGPVLSNLRRNPNINGYRVTASGRFTKKEIATYEWFRFGSVPTSTLNAKLDFAIMPFVLKYSLCCFKVWIHKKYNKFSIKELSNYFFKDILSDSKGNIMFNIINNYNKSNKRILFYKHKSIFHKNRSIAKIYIRKKNLILSLMYSTNNIKKMFKNYFFNLNRKNLIPLFKKYFFQKLDLSRKYFLKNNSLFPKLLNRFSYNRKISLLLFSIFNEFRGILSLKRKKRKSYIRGIIKRYKHNYYVKYSRSRKVYSNLLKIRL